MRSGLRQDQQTPGALALPAAAVLLDITRSLLEAGHDEQALARIAFEKAGAHLGADAGFNYRFDAQSGELVLVEGLGIPARLQDIFRRRPLGQGEGGGGTVGCQNLVVDAPGIALQAEAALIRMLDVRAHACCPLLGQQGELLGTFSLASTRRDSFTQEELHLLQSLSHIIALIWERLRSEQALRHREEHLCVALDAGRLGTWWRDLQTGIFHMDARARAHFGFDVEAVSHETLLARVHPEDVPRLQQEVSEANASAPDAANRSIDYRVIHPDGSVHWLEVQGKVYRESPNSSRHARVRIGTSTDVTERKRIEQALRQATQDMKRAQAMTRVGSWRIADPDRHTFECSEEAYRIFEVPPGTPVDYQRFLASIHPEDRERVAAQWSAALKDGRNYDIEYRILARGKVKWVRAKAELELDAEGRLVASFGTLQDITDRKLAELALRESEASLSATFEQAAVGIVHVDAQGRFLRVNRKYAEMLGYSAQELLGMHVQDVTLEPDREISRAEFQRMAAGEIGSFTIEKRYRRRDASIIWVRITASAVLDPHTGVFRYNVSMVEDISAYREAEQRARDAALHDPLTQLPNRRLVFEYAELLLAAATRRHSQGALLFIDLDRFKPVNDVYGHEVGDRLLEEVARRLRACLREEDLVGRLGGDEFVIVLQHLEAPHHAIPVARHVIEQVSRPVEIRGLSVSVSPSIGISLFPQHGLDMDTLIHAADLAMYQAKQSGAGNYEIYTPDLSHRAEHLSALEARLKRALQRHSLTLHYQPVIDMRSGRPSGAEALLRFADEEGPPLGPQQFIPVAEAAGLIGQIGEWVATEACRQHVAWRAEGLPPIPIAVNVSPLEFRQRHFAERLISIVRDSGIAPGCFQVEVTESTVMDSVSEAIETLQALKAAGIKVALDDFGTGYSSLSRLSQLPLDKLKVDQSFVARVEHDPASRAITEAVIALGRSLHLEVVGEGIESDQALSYLDAQGCDQGQGYLFSRPLPQDEFAGWYRRQWSSPQADGAGRGAGAG